MDARHGGETALSIELYVLHELSERDIWFELGGVMDIQMDIFGDVSIDSWDRWRA